MHVTEPTLLDSVEALFHTTLVGVVYQKATGEIVAANPAAEDILGLSADELAGRRSTDPRWRAVREDGSEFAGDQHPSMQALRTRLPVRNAIMGIYNPATRGYAGSRWTRVPVRAIR